jgi:hypothetical protein
VRAGTAREFSCAISAAIAAAAGAAGETVSLSEITRRLNAARSAAVECSTGAAKDETVSAMPGRPGSGRGSAGDLNDTAASSATAACVSDVWGARRGGAGERVRVVEPELRTPKGEKTCMLPEPRRTMPPAATEARMASAAASMAAKLTVWGLWVAAATADAEAACVAEAEGVAERWLFP